MAKFDLFEAIHTQRAIRQFKPDPVPQAIINEILDAAIRAPSASNRQPWAFLVITESGIKNKIAALYNRSWNEVFGENTDSNTLPTHTLASATYLAEHMAEAPMLVLACIQHDGSNSTLTRGSSIYPAVQNLMLAARGLGIGSVLTTLHKRYEEQIKSILGVPENVETAALIPLGYPAETARFGSNRRTPVEEVTYWNKWGQKSKWTA